MCQLHEKSLESIATLRRDLDAAKLEIVNTRDTYNEDIARLTGACKRLDQETKNRERELIQRLTVDHELEMNDIRKSLGQKDEELQTVCNEKTALEAVHMDAVTQHESEKSTLRESVEKLTEELQDARKALEALEASKDQAISEARDKLIKEHKNEVESMRSRIRMITSVDRSPSDTSLEKIERPDMIDLVNHETIIAQLREEFQRERDSAIAAALELERARHESLVTIQPPGSSPIGGSGGRSPTTMTSENVLRRMIEERDKQLEAMREREAVLVKENLKYRDTIQSLADSEITSSNQSILRDRVEQLQREKEAVEAELQKLKKTKANVAVSGGKQVREDFRVRIELNFGGLPQKNSNF